MGAHRTRVLGVSLAFVLAVSCSSSSKDTTTAGPATTKAPGAEIDEGTPKAGGVVDWGLEAETDGLNPLSGRFAMSGHMVASAIYDPLVTLDNEGKWAPYLADSVTPNSDFTEWTIKVHPGVKFHDGKDLTADAVAHTLSQATTSAMVGKAVADIKSVEVSGPLEVRVGTRQPWANFPYTLATQIGYIAEPSMLDDPAQARQPVGTGPFKFASWDYGHKFKAVKNPDYWRKDDQGNQLPYLDAINFVPQSDAQTRVNALLNGELDAIHVWKSTDVVRLEASPGIKVLAYNKGEKRMIMLNSRSEPFKNKSARLAVEYATDPARVQELIGAGIGVTTNQIWSPGEPGYRDDPGYLGFNLDKAKEMVAQYKQETGKDLSFTYTADTNFDASVQQLYKEMWEAAGMKVEIKGVEQSDLVVLAALGNYQAVDWRFFGATDPDAEYVWLSSRSIDPNLISLNFAQYANPELDAALDDGRRASDPQARDDAYAKVARILNENSPYVWIERVTWAIASSDRVHGYGAAANGSIQTLGPKTWVATLWKG